MLFQFKSFARIAFNKTAQICFFECLFQKTAAKIAGAFALNRKQKGLYLYPKNLKAKANLWLWGMKDFLILCVLAVVSVILLVEFGWLVPAAVTLCFAFLTIRKEDMTVLDYIRYAVKYFLTDQQYYEWRQ